MPPLILIVLCITLCTGQAHAALKDDSGIAVTYYCTPAVRTFCNLSSCTRETTDLHNAVFTFSERGGRLGACLATDCYAGQGEVIRPADQPSRFTAIGVVRSERRADSSPPPGKPPFPLALSIDTGNDTFSAIWGMSADGTDIDQGTCNRLIAVDPIQFAHDSIQLSGAAKKQLHRLTRLLMAQPGLDAEIVGHTDERGSNEYCLALGERMAKATANYLTENGVPPARLRVLSSGKEQPLDRRHTRRAWDRNRRVEITVREGRQP